MAGMTTTAGVALYARLSHNPDGTKTGTDRQLEDCHLHAERLGLAVAGEYVDDDVSAYRKGVKRPAFTRMCEDLAAGAISGVICWKLDRLARKQADLARVFELCANGDGFVISMVDGIDTRTGTGQMMAEILTSVARQESENTSIRSRRWRKAVADRGEPHVGGRRPFGYTDQTRQTVNEDEARLLNEAATRLLTGDGIATICKDWEKRGVKSATGRTMSRTALRKALTNPTVAGLRTHNGAIVEAPGRWPAILERPVWERVGAVLRAPARAKEDTRRRHLLGGIAICGRCEAGMRSKVIHKRRRYQCEKDPGTGACGRMIIQAEALDEFIYGAVIAAIDGPGLAAMLAADDGLLEQLRTDEERLDQVAKDHYLHALISREEFMSVSAALRARIEATREKLALHTTLPAINDSGQVRARWPELSVSARRGIIRAVLERVVIHPGVPGRKQFDPQRVELVPAGG